jgi:hypothetical protein
MSLTPPFLVWVDLTAQWGSSNSPGVLLSWRKSRRGEWQGWVIYASSYSSGSGLEVNVMQGWVPAHLVRPADG